MRRLLVTVAGFLAGVLGVCVGFAVYMSNLMGKGTDIDFLSNEDELFDE